MVELYINNKLAVLPQTFSIRLVRYNPLLNRKGDYSIPFSIPLSENRQIINHADRVEAESYQKTGTFKLAINGIIRYRGTVVFRDPKPEQDEISLYLKSDNSAFFSGLKDVSLQDYDFGGEDNGSLTTDEVEDQWADSLNDIYPNKKYACAPVKSPNLWEHDSRLAYYRDKNINEWDYQNEKMYRDGQNWHQHMYVRYLLDRIIQKEGYIKGDDDLDDIPDMNRLVVVTMNSVWGPFNVEYKYNLPKRKIMDLLESLRTLYTITLVTENKTNKVHVRMLSKVVSDAELVEDLDRSETKDTIKKSEKQPDGFVMEFENLSGGEYDYARAPANESEASSVTSYNDLPTADITHENQLYYIIKTERFYRCIEDPDNQGSYKWKEVGGLQNKEEGEKELEKKSDIELMLQERLSKNVYRSGPNHSTDFESEESNTTRKGNDMFEVTYSGMTYNDFPLIFGFYRGINTLDLNDPYVLAECGHDKDNTDLESEWQDPRGNNWTLTEVVDSTHLKFIRVSHSSDLQGADVLTHVSGATHTNDINIGSATNKEGVVNYPILSIDAYRYDNESEFSSDAISNKWTTTRGLYEKIHKTINHWETQRKRKIIKYMAVPNRRFFDMDLTKKYKISGQIFMINKLEMDITEKDFDEKIVKAELFTV
jgi:hypothetical protein